jgi:hypothetical protein
VAVFRVPSRLARSASAPRRNRGIPDSGIRRRLQLLDDAKAPNHQFVDLQPPNSGTANHQAPNGNGSDRQSSHRHRPEHHGPDRICSRSARTNRLRTDADRRGGTGTRTGLARRKLGGTPDHWFVKLGVVRRARSQPIPSGDLGSYSHQSLLCDTGKIPANLAYYERRGILDLPSNNRSSHRPPLKTRIT